MANWNKEMVTPEQINGGNEFTPNDDLSVTELNAIVNNSFFSAETAKEAKEIAENAKEASDNFVSYATQTPTDAQKQQARDNIGAVAKATNPTENNLASLDTEGNIKDSGTTAFKLANRYAKATMSADCIVPARDAWSGLDIPFANIEQSISNRFTLSNGILTYNGDETIVVEIQFNLHYTTIQGTRPSVVQGFIRKNGSTLFSTEVNGVSFYSCTLTASNITTLTKGDTIKLMTQFESATSADSRKFTSVNTNILIKEISVV